MKKIISALIFIAIAIIFYFLSDIIYQEIKKIYSLTAENSAVSDLKFLWAPFIFWLLVVGGMISFFGVFRKFYSFKEGLISGFIFAVIYGLFFGLIYGLYFLISDFGFILGLIRGLTFGLILVGPFLGLILGLVEEFGG